MARRLKVALISWPAGLLALPTGKRTVIHVADQEAAEESLRRSPARKAGEASDSLRAHTLSVNGSGSEIGNGVVVMKRAHAVAVDGKSIEIETGITSVNGVAEATRVVPREGLGKNGMSLARRLDVGLAHVKTTGVDVTGRRARTLPQAVRSMKAVSDLRLLLADRVLHHLRRPRLLLVRMTDDGEVGASCAIVSVTVIGIVRVNGITIARGRLVGLTASVIDLGTKEDMEMAADGEECGWEASLNGPDVAREE